MPEFKELKVLGKKLQYKNISDLSKKVHAPGKTAKERNDNSRALIRNLKKPKVIYDEKKGHISSIDLTHRDAPLLIRQFTGRRRINAETRNDILFNDVVRLNDNKTLVYPMETKMSTTDVMQLTYTVRITAFVLSSEIIRRTVTGQYTGPVNPSIIDDMKRLIFNVKPRYIIKRLNDNKKLPRTYNDDMIYQYNRLQKYLKYSTDFDINAAHPFIKEVRRRIMNDYSFADWIMIDEIDAAPGKENRFNTNRRFDIKKMRMFLPNPSNISVNLYNETIDIKMTDNNCVTSYLKNKYKSTKINIDKYFKKAVPNYETSGLSTDDLMTFCAHYNIKMIAYDIAGRCIARHDVTDSRAKKASLVYIAYSSHIYPVKNHLLNKISFQKFKECRTNADAVNDKFYQLMQQKIIPTNIHVSDTQNEKLRVSSFVHDGTMYYTNDDYDLCMEILKLFDIADQMTPYVNRFNIMEKIEQLYGITGTRSFFPMLKNNHGLYHDYRTADKKIFDYYDKFITNDKNKMYPCALHNLNFLQVVDIRKTPIKKYDNTPVCDEWLYMATPDTCSHLMPDEGYYSGEELKYNASQGLKFKIIRYVECQTVPNDFKKMLTDYYYKTSSIDGRDNKDIIKRIMNIWIGKFDHGCDSIKTSLNVDKICNGAEAELSDGTIYPIDSDNNFVVSKKEKYNIYTRKLIKYQLLNRSRRILYEQMKKMNLTSANIVDIKTDAFTYLPDDATIIDATDYDANDFFKWKLENTKDSLKCDDEPEYILNECIIDNPAFDTYLYDGYAGCGKTYTIINNVLPKYGDDYIVLSPSHSSIEDYRHADKNCQVIQYYEYTQELPDESVIIIDEIGMCSTSANNMIYRCMLAGKTVMCYGDYKQMQPVKDVACDSVSYLKYAYTHIKKITTNERNNFTIAYYDSLINETIDLKEEIKKHSVSLYDAEYVICATNAQCDKYNQKIMKHKKMTMYTPGCLMMCKTNKLRKMNIYNNFILSVVNACDADDETVTLRDKNAEYVIPMKKYKMFFTPAYARTLYNCQGKTLTSYHVPHKILDCFNDGRSAYTIISRLKQNITRAPAVNISSRPLTGCVFDELINTPF